MVGSCTGPIGVMYLELSDLFLMVVTERLSSAETSSGQTDLPLVRLDVLRSDHFR